MASVWNRSRSSDRPVVRMPDIVAQSGERLTVNERADGSSPSDVATVGPQARY